MRVLKLISCLMLLIISNIYSSSQSPEVYSFTVENVAQLQEAAVVRFEESQVLDVQFAPDNRTVAVASRSNIYLIDVMNPSGDPRLLSGHEDVVWDLDFSPDGRWLASGSRDRTLRLWDTSTGQLRTTFTDHLNPRTRSGDILALAFSPDSRYIAGASDSNAAYLWNVETLDYEGIMSDNGMNSDVTSIAYSNDGQIIVTAEEFPNLRLWNSPSLVPANTIFLNDPESTTDLVFSPDGSTLAMSAKGYDDNWFVMLWDTRRWTESNRLVGTGRRISDINFSPDGRMIAVSGDQNKIQFWNVENQQNIHAIQSLEYIEAISISSDSKWLIAGGMDTTLEKGSHGAVSLWSIPTGLSSEQELPAPPDGVNYVGIIEGDGQMVNFIDDNFKPVAYLLQAKPGEYTVTAVRTSGNLLPEVTVFDTNYEIIGTGMTTFAGDSSTPVSFVTPGGAYYFIVVQREGGTNGKSTGEFSLDLTYDASVPAPTLPPKTSTINSQANAQVLPTLTSSTSVITNTPVPISTLPSINKRLITENCPNTKTVSLQIGGFAKVQANNGVRIRNEPTVNGRQVGGIPDGGDLVVLDGPVCSDGYQWVQVFYYGNIGWSVASTESETLMFDADVNMRDVQQNLNAVFQRFEGGFMIWVRQYKQIFVLYNTGVWDVFVDTFQTGAPESDPSIVPPQGKYQPIRGFGEVWRNYPEVREQLGWADALERGEYDMQYEYHFNGQITPSGDYQPGIGYRVLTRPNGSKFNLYDDRSWSN